MPGYRAPTAPTRYLSTAEPQVERQVEGETVLLMMRVLVCKDWAQFLMCQCNFFPREHPDLYVNVLWEMC